MLFEFITLNRRDIITRVSTAVMSFAVLQTGNVAKAVRSRRRIAVAEFIAEVAPAYALEAVVANVDLPRSA